MKQIRIEKPAVPMIGTVVLPASKSISNRLLVIRQLSGVDAVIDNLSDSDDTRAMQSCLEKIRHSSSETDRVEINSEDAGTVMRFLTAALAITPGKWLLTGSERMKQRPLKPLVDALLSLGADIEYVENEGYPPLRINGKPFEGGKVTVHSGESSQYISALIMIAPLLRKGLLIELLGTPVSAPYLDMTLQILEQFGASYKLGIQHIEIPEGKYTFNNCSVEPDWSAASYWYALVALGDKAQITLNGLKTESLQGDRLVADIYRGFGVQTNFTTSGAELKVAMPHKNNFRLNFMHFPDLTQTVAITALGLGIPASLTGLNNLRIKETDRIAALAKEIGNAGCKVVESKDSLELINPKEVFPPGLTINTYNDHRMAMAFAPLSLKTGSLIINDPEVVSKSYPGFWNDLKKVGFKIKKS